MKSWRAASLVLGLAVLAAGVAQAQQDDPMSGDMGSDMGADMGGFLGGVLEDETSTTTPQSMAEAPGALLRGLDKIAATSTDLRMDVGQTASYGGLEITLFECRYPADDPGAKAVAHLSIFDLRANQEVFRGWMLSDSPALSALDHPRYDVWVIRCRID